MKFRNVFYGVEPFTPPCKQVLKIDSNYVEQPDTILNKHEVELAVNYRSPTHKEIKQIRAYTVMTLFGNVGGFIGILLGYALIQIPMLLRTLFESWNERKSLRCQCMRGV